MEKVPLKKNPGFLLLGCLVAALAFILIPNLIRAQESNPPLETGTAALAQIEHNLKIIELAKEQWALENKKGGNDFVWLTDLTGHFPNYIVPSVRATQVRFEISNVESLTEAHLRAGVTLNGKTGPFTLTSF